MGGKAHDEWMITRVKVGIDLRIHRFDDFDARVDLASIEFRGDGHANGDMLVAVYAKGDARDYHAGTVVDIKVGTPARAVTGYDLLNGTGQKLQFTSEGDQIVIRNLRVYDYPLVLRIKP